MCRLKNGLQPWVCTWAEDTMFAGFQGWGAQDAHYETAIRLEHAKTLGQPFTGCVADLWKAFDVIPRTLLGFLLRASGMPQGILDAYLRFHDNLNVYNFLAGGYGQPYFKSCSIPQGCPFSMLFMSLLLTALSRMIKQCFPAIVIRFLADDLLVTYVGEQLCVIIQAFNLILEYLHDIGGKVRS